jgi:hypothetical protein
MASLESLSVFGVREPARRRLVGFVYARPPSPGLLRQRYPLQALQQQVAVFLMLMALKEVPPCDDIPELVVGHISGQAFACLEPFD